MSLAVPATVTLRSATDADEAFLCRVYASTREEELAPVPWTAAEKEAFVASQFRAQSAYWREHYPGASWDVVEVDGAPAGRFYTARWADEIRVVDIALLPEFRRRGIGESLLRDVIDEAARTGRAVRIHVEHLNPAKRLYERLGFREVADRGYYLLMERSPEGSVS